MKKIRIAINGFGRIGKTAFRIAWQYHRKNVDVVAINDPNSTECAAQVLKYDSVYHLFPFDVGFTARDLVVDGKHIPKLVELDPAQLPWKKMKVDVVLECTGVFTKKQDAAKHLTAGAQAVIISAPAKGGEHVGTYVMGVNHTQHSAAKEPLISNASCTTNSIAPVMQVLDEVFGIKKAMMSTIHGYTADQNLVDGSHRDPRRARSAAINIVPTTTGAATATAETVPSLRGIFDGVAFRVPVPVGSVSDITALLKRKVTVDDVNAALTEASKSKRYKGILAVTHDPMVSSDIIGNPVSSLVDLQLTNVVAGNLVKVVAWYDNEYGYSHRLVEQAIAVGKDLIT